MNIKKNKRTIFIEQLVAEAERELLNRFDRNGLLKLETTIEKT